MNDIVIFKILHIFSKGVWVSVVRELFFFFFVGGGGD